MIRQIKMKFHKFLNIILCFILLPSAYSLYEDQIGKFDWRLQLIGKVTKVVYDSASDKDGQTKRLYAITDQNVLAGLNWLTGEIVWRHVFEQNENGRVSDLLLSHAGDIITLSGGGQYLMNWERHRGTLRWSAIVTNEHCETSKMVEYKNGNVVVLSPCSGTLSAFDRSGTQTWTLSLSKHVGAKTINWRDLAGGGGELAVLGEDVHSSSLTVLLISTNGDVVRTISKEIKYDENKVAILSHPIRLVWFETDNGIVNSLMLSAPGSSDQVFTASPSDVASGPYLRLKKYSDRYFALEDDKNIWIPTTGSAPADFKFEKVEGTSVGFINLGDNAIYAAIASSSGRGGFVVHFFDTKTLKQMNEWDLIVPATDSLSTPDSIYPFVQSKSDRSTNVAGIFVTGIDHTLALINYPGKLVWTRQEALASILSVELLDLPLSEAQANIEEEFSTNGTMLSTFVRRVTLQMIQLQRVLLNAVNDVFGLANLLGKSGESIVAPLSSIIGSPSERDKGSTGKANRLERDYFNLHKIIVVTTAAGKIFGLDNLRGTIVWQKHLSDISPFTKLQKPMMPLYVMRTTAHYPHPAHCAILAKSKVNGNGVFITFNPITGSNFQLLHLKKGIKQSFLIPVVDKDELQGIGVVTEDMKAYLYPSSISEPFQAFIQQKPFIVFMADVGGHLNGFRVVGAASKGGNNYENDFAVFSLDPTWKSALPLEKQGKLVGVTMKRFTEQVHSQGRVLGDRSVLYKYVNPNLVAVIAESTDSAGKNQMNMFLLDAVTGDVIFNAVHRRVTGPYHLVHCENWIVYTYWNEKARRNEIAVLELYEGKEQIDASSFSSFKPPPPPIVMRQAYVFPQGIMSLAVTDTEKGITTRHLLIAMPFGGILELSKLFLDPRRVLNPTMEEREEGLFPYIPDLPIMTEQIINYNQSVYNIRAIHTAPSGLESTSLVLAYGLDLYFTRVTPSGTFDILKDDFDHWFIGCVLLGLFIASAVTKKLARLRDVKSAWR